MTPKRRSVLVGIFLLLTTFILTSCGSGWKELTRDEKAKGSLLFLYIDTDEMSGHLDRVVFRHVKAGEATDYWGCKTYKQKYAWFEGLPKGKYMLDNYGGTDGVDFLWVRWGGNTNYTYQFPAQGSGFEIDQKGVYFLGAFKHKRIKGKGFFSADKFDLVKVKQPSEGDIFEVVLKQLKSDGSPLVPMAEKYMEKL